MNIRKLGMSTLGMAVALPLSAGMFHAVAPAAGTKVTAKLKAGTTMTLVGTIEGIPITVTCKSFSGSGTAPASGTIDVTLPAPPKITECTDSIGGTDTVTTNQTSGKWKLAEVKSGSTTSLNLTMPTAGATFSSSIDPSCVITAAPKAAATMKGSFKSSGTDAGTDTVKNAAIPVASSSTCTTSATSTISATVVIAPVK
jgi:hypothetical protein